MLDWTWSPPPPAEWADEHLFESEVGFWPRHGESGFKVVNCLM